MFDLLLHPVVSAVATVLAATHSIAGTVGLPPGSAGAWLLAIALLVVGMRTVTLPVLVHGMRVTHARARALPALTDLRRRYEGVHDLDRLHEMRAEQRRIHAEHGVSRWALAPVLLQLPLLYALYRVVSDLATGHAVGALDMGLVASASAASMMGLHLTTRLGGALAQGPMTGATLIGLALLAAALSFATQRWFVLPMTDVAAAPAALASVQHVMPWLVAVGIVAAVAFVPTGLVVYWVLNNAWTLVQQGLVWRFAPTPGSPAALRRSA